MTSFEPIPSKLCTGFDDLYQRQNATTNGNRSAAMSQEITHLFERLRELEADRRQLGS